MFRGGFRQSPTRPNTARAGQRRLERECVICLRFKKYLTCCLDGSEKTTSWKTVKVSDVVQGSETPFYFSDRALVVSPTICVKNVIGRRPQT